MPAEDLLAPSVATWSASDGPLVDVLADRDPADLALVVGLLAGDEPWDRRTREALETAGFAPAELLETHEPSSDTGTSTTIRMPRGEQAARVLVLVGLGTGAPADLRAAGAAAGRAVRG
ncbi:M17 family peptidase N-terminal domain-containing protein, partial [Knoellia flava]